MKAERYRCPNCGIDLRPFLQRIKREERKEIIKENLEHYEKILEECKRLGIALTEEDWNKSIEEVNKEDPIKLRVAEIELKIRDLKKELKELEEMEN